MERTLVLIKPDGVQRGLIGEVIGRFERVGLKIIALKLAQADHDQVDKHYALTEGWMKGVYDKAKEKYAEKGEDFPHPDHISYGTYIKNGLLEYLKSSPVVAMVLEGEGAVSLVRKLAGATEPASAAPGTIRGDLTHDTYALANNGDRPVRNIIHASGNVDEAENEIGVWFTEAEVHLYDHANDPVLFDPKRFK
ncbi:MAG: nucleoside-diphosphate kinase [Patescibacteria group bacterium]|nr:nucleoside-diphosphate kinase [Patescibacteria group bacterium]MBU2509539.1 nucleoside-diphosphate kinase [Patescibacteria group bacterium]